MEGITRTILVIAGSSALVLAAGFLLDLTWATALWPYQSYSGLWKVFVGSILAAIGAPVIWIALSGELAAVRPGAVNIIISGTGLATQALIRPGSTDPFLGFGLACLAMVCATVVLLVVTRRVEWRDKRRMPAPVRVAFALFATVLIGVGSALIMGAQVFPWPLDRDSSVSYGLIFIGAAAYFLYGLARPVWGTAKGQLIGFLAYDLVLLWPYMQRWPGTSGSTRLSLTVYLLVLLGSGALAIWYLLLDPRYRLTWTRRGRAPLATSSGAELPS